MRAGGGDSGCPNDLRCCQLYLLIPIYLFPADVHVHLGDIGLENEAFEGALGDYQEAAELLAGLGGDAAAGPSAAPAPSELARRRAEALYKQGVAWQFLDNAGEALSAVQAAGRELDALLASGAEPPSEDLAALRAELEDKTVELRAAVEEQAQATAAVKALLKQYTGALLGSAKDGSGASGVQGASGATLAEPSAEAAPVKDLGVIGRGTKRVTLQPRNAPAAGAEESKAKDAGDDKKRRRLEDLMTGTRVCV